MAAHKQNDDVQAIKELIGGHFRGVKLSLRRDYLATASRSSRAVRDATSRSSAALI
jgi:hypothetical protein